MPSFNKRNSRDDNSKNSRGSFSKNPAKKFSPSRDRQDKPGFRDRNEENPYGKPHFSDRNRVDRGGDERRDERRGERRGREERPNRDERRNPDNRRRNDERRSDDRRSDDRRDNRRSTAPSGKSPYGKAPAGKAPYGKAPYGKAPYGKATAGKAPYGKSPAGKAPFGKPKTRGRQDSSGQRFEADPINDGLIRLNRYISNSGICSRRKADELIEAGVISVNGEVVTTLGSKVDPAKDDIRYNGERLKREKMVYVLLNKPKDYITTTDDPQERRTVMHLVAKASRERIYPVGRLDRNTTGLLLMTNDGFLAEKLSHPRNRISKLYYVELSKNLTQGDFNKIEFGLELEDGFIKPDDLSYVQGSSKREVGIQIHSGKNRIVRRIFEHLGYDVVKLDRVVYANLTKKDLPRGHWRYLDEHEIVQLKHLIK